VTSRAQRPDSSWNVVAAARRSKVMITTWPLSALAVTLSLTVFASPASAIPDTAAIAGKSANPQPNLSIYAEEPAQSKCDQPGCRFVTSKIHCEQEEPDAPVHCVMSPEAIQIAKSSYWYTMHSCQFYPGGGHRTPQETAACRIQGAHDGPSIRFCRNRDLKGGPLPCGPNQ
jgi:hypothetical protein